MADSSASYIRMIQHLIEQCIIFHMNQEQCVEALSKHANIKPVITNTVWKELEKENKEFFEAYKKQREGHVSLEEQERHRILEILSDSSERNSDDD